MGDLKQFIEWLQTRRVDWDIPYRIERIDIVGFINNLAAEKATAVTRRRKLAAIRGFLKFCKDNQIIFGNPADTIPGPIREQKDLARNETSMDQRTVRYRIHKYYEKAGIRKKGSVHTLRHTFATHQVHNGLKINQLKEVLGQEDGNHLQIRASG